jgi:hypothetical protein
MFKSPLKSKNNKTQIEEVIFDEEDYDESDDVSIGSLFSSTDSDDDNGFTKQQSEIEDVVDSRNYVLIEYHQNSINTIKIKSSNIENRKARKLNDINSRENNFVSKETQSLIVSKVPYLRDQSFMFKINNQQRPLRNKSSPYFLKGHPLIQGNIYRQNSNYISVVKASNNLTPVNKNEYIVRNAKLEPKSSSPNKRVIAEYKKPELIYSNLVKSGKKIEINSRQSKTDYFTKQSFSRLQNNDAYERSSNKKSGSLVIIKTPIANGTSMISKRLNNNSQIDLKNEPYHSRNSQNKILLINSPEYQNPKNKIFISNNIKPEAVEKKKIRVVTFLDEDSSNDTSELEFSYKNAEKKYLFPYINFGNHNQSYKSQNLYKNNINNLESETKFFKIESKNKVTPIDFESNLSSSNPNYFLYNTSSLNKRF